MKKSNNLTRFDGALQKFNSIHLRDHEQQESWQEISRKIAEDKKRSTTPFLTYALSAVAVIGLAIVGFTTFQGYFTKQAENPVVVVPEEDNEEDDVVEDEGFFLEEPSKENIEGLLVERGVENFEWSLGETRVAFVDLEEVSGPVLIWDVGESEPRVVPELVGSLATLFVWAPDESTVIVREGTSVSGGANIVDAVGLESIGWFSFVMEVVWSPNSAFIAFGQAENPPVAAEIEGIGLSVYHVESGAVMPLIPGDTQNYYIPSSWTEELFYKEVSWVTGESVEKSMDVGFLYGEDSGADDGEEVGSPLDVYNVFAPYDIGPVNYLSEDVEFFALKSTNYVLQMGTLADAGPLYRLYEVNEAGDGVSLVRTPGPGGYMPMDPLLEKENWLAEVVDHLLESGDVENEVYFAYHPEVSEELVNVNGEAMWLYPVEVGKDTFYFKRGEGLWAKHLANDRVMNNYLEEQFVYRDYLH